MLTEDNFIAVEQSIEEDPNESIRRCAQQFELCPTTLCKILRAYKIQHVQGLKPNDHQAPLTFSEWVQNEMATDPDFQKKILFIDEAHFWLNGYVNKQNCHIRSDGNPQVIVETPLHP